ncbi:vWA domain-containing protein [Gimesia maris]|uniref:vWA domain-containing protein n=1 Tax=Gimesia maris TaxID=122 RepID=UPI0032ECA627
MVTVIQKRSRLTYASLVAILLFSMQQVVLGATSQQPAPDVVTIAIIDCSGSMEPERITVAKTELKSLCAQSPCSAASPWVLVPFTEESTPTAQIQDNTKLIATIQGLRADGGTKIAAGLNAAATVCAQYSNSVLRVILITDAEDPDQKSISAAEDRLAEIFGKRSETSGLPAQLIVRRWGNGGATLAKRLATQPNVQVIDSLGSSRLVYAILNPEIKVDKVVRSSEHLTVTITATVSSEGNSSLVKNSPSVQCMLTDEKFGLSPLLFEIDQGDTGVTREIKIPFPSETAAGKVLLPFKFKVPAPNASNTNIMVPSLTRAGIDVSVMAPELERTSRCELKAKQLGDARWIDRNKLLAEADVELQMKASTDVSGSYPHPILFDIATNAADCQLREPVTVEIDRPNDTVITRVAIQFKVPLSNSKTTFTATAKSPPLYHKISGGPIKASLDIASPSKIETMVDVTVDDVIDTHWIDFKEGIVEGTVSLNINVDGPLIEGKVLHLVSPAGILGFDLSNEMIKSGAQQIDLRFQLDCQKTDVDKVKVLSWRLRTDADPLIELKIKTPVQFSVKIPSAIPLLSRDGDIRINAGKGGQAALIDFVPCLPDNVVISPNKLDVIIDGDVIGRRTTEIGESVSANLAVDAHGNFWTDVVKASTLTMTPATEWTAIEPGIVNITVSYPARFKTVAMFIGMGVFVVSAFFMFFYVGRILFTNPLKQAEEKAQSYGEDRKWLRQENNGFD